MFLVIFLNIVLPLIISFVLRAS